MDTKPSPNTCTDTPDLSIVIPAYNEEGNIQELFKRLHKVLDAMQISWEIIFADDGSRDRTWELLDQLHNQYPNVKAIRFSRNFGHQYALFAGIKHSTGRAVISMDGDLQHPPEVIPELYDKWKQGNKIVNTIRKDPADFTLIKRVLAYFYYKAFSFLSGVNLKHGMADFRLLDRSVVRQLMLFREEGLFLRGLVQWVGFKKADIEFQCEERFSGTTKYSFRKMARFAWHGISSFSIVPLRLGIMVGMVTSFLSFLWLAEAVYTKVILNAAVPGWASTVGILSFLFGILFIFLGLIGEYIGRILVQVRDRPLFIISDSIGIDTSL